MALFVTNGAKDNKELAVPDVEEILANEVDKLNVPPAEAKGRIRRYGLLLLRRPGLQVQRCRNAFTCRSSVAPSASAYAEE